MTGDEAPATGTSALQDAVRQLLAEQQANAQTHAHIAEMRRSFEVVGARLDRHLAESERDRADTEQALGELRASFARIEAEVKRLADAKTAQVELERARVAREVETATVAAARWKERATMWAGIAGVVGLIAKEVVEWLRKP